MSGFLGWLLFFSRALSILGKFLGTLCLRFFFGFEMSQSHLFLPALRRSSLCWLWQLRIDLSLLFFFRRVVILTLFCLTNFLVLFCELQPLPSPPPRPPFLLYLCVLRSVFMFMCGLYQQGHLIFLEQRLTIVGSTCNLRLTECPRLDWNSWSSYLAPKAKVSGPWTLLCSGPAGVEIRQLCLGLF